MWTCALKWPSLQVASYLEILLVRRDELDLLDCSKFHLLYYSDYRSVCAQMVLGSRPSLAGHWRFKVSLQDKQDFQEQLIRIMLRN